MPLFAIPFPAIDPVAIAIGPHRDPLVRAGLCRRASSAAGTTPAGSSRPTASGAPLRRPSRPTSTTSSSGSALGVVLGGRIGYVLFYNLADLPGGPDRDPGGLARRHVVPRRLPRAPSWRSCCSPAPRKLNASRYARHGRGGHADRPVLRPHRQFHQRRALGPRRRPTSPMRSSFPMAGPLPRHPSQLYEAFAEGLVLFVVWPVAVRRFGFRRPGLLGGIFVLGYALARIILRVLPRAGRAARLPVRQLDRPARGRHHHGDAAVACRWRSSGSG